MDSNYDHQMYLSKSKCWYSNNCLDFLKRVVPLGANVLKTVKTAAIFSIFFFLI